MILEVKDINKKKVWEEFVLGQHPNVFLQSWNWGEAHRRLGKKTFRLGLFANGRLVGLALAIKEPAKRGAYLAIPGGPVLSQWKEAWLKRLLKALKQRAREEGVVFLRVRPNIENNQPNQKLFKKLGFIPAPMHLHAESTLQLDLTLSLEEILAQMRKNTRYSIRRAQREGVTTEISLKVKDIGLLYRLQMETVKRHRFVPFPKDFFQAHFQAFLEDKQIVLIKARYQQETLAIGMFVFYGDMAIYHYSGSSSKHPRVFASYAMLWQAIQEAKKRGCRFFDLWGVAPEGKSRHRFAGVSLFKRGFGGQEVDYLPAQDLSVSPLYWLTYLFETMRRLRRGL